jgi:hypothetical protein
MLFRGLQAKYLDGRFGRVLRKVLAKSVTCHTAWQNLAYVSQVASGAKHRSLSRSEPSPQ